MYSVIASTGSLEYYRGQVDHLTDITAHQALDQYSSIIDNQIHAFQELSQVDDGDLTSQAGPLVVAGARGRTGLPGGRRSSRWPGRRGSLDEHGVGRSYVQLVSARRWVVEDQLDPVPERHGEGPHRGDPAEPRLADPDRHRGPGARGRAHRRRCHRRSPCRTRRQQWATALTDGRASSTAR